MVRFYHQHVPHMLRQGSFLLRQEREQTIRNLAQKNDFPVLETVAIVQHGHLALIPGQLVTS